MSQYNLVFMNNLQTLSTKNGKPFIYPIFFSLHKKMVVKISIVIFFCLTLLLINVNHYYYMIYVFCWQWCITLSAFLTYDQLKYQTSLLSYIPCCYRIAAHIYCSIVQLEPKMDPKLTLNHPPFRVFPRWKHFTEVLLYLCHNL